MHPYGQRLMKQIDQIAKTISKLSQPVSFGLIKKKSKALPKKFEKNLVPFLNPESRKKKKSGKVVL